MNTARRAEWTAGIAFAAVAGIVLVVATSFVESTGVRFLLFGLAIAGILIAAFVLDAWVSAAPTQGAPQFKGSVLRNLLVRLRHRDWFAGVVAMWLLAALVIGGLALLGPTEPWVVAAGIAVIIVAAIAFVWADVTPVESGERQS